MPDFIMQHSNPMGLLMHLYLLGIIGIGVLGFVIYAISELLRSR